ncbi:MAG: alpha-E domain-containing protein [Bryobacterales bacterium]|jgi:uncharacterized alpha-E superfamily protein|nr:alpha-E domain-containing protein [Bryobacterales bacterium]
MTNPLLSRVAESVYWMARYIERAENVARVVDVNLQLMLDLAGNASEQWQPLIQISADDERFHARYGAPSKEGVIYFLTFDEENPNSILTCLRMAREGARSIRECISSEMYEQINRAYLMVKAAASDRTVMESPVDFFQEVRLAGHLFEGLTEATMTHGEAWHFCRLGRMIERADKTTRLLDVKYFILLPSVAYVGSTFDELQWVALLKSASGFEMYRRVYGRISPDSVVEFLLLDREFPRSVHYCIAAAQHSLHAVSGTPLGTFRSPAEQQLGMLRSELDYSDNRRIIEAGLHEMLDLLQAKLNRIDDAVFDTFFALQPKFQRQVALNASA